MKGQFDGIKIAARVRSEGEFESTADKIDTFGFLGGERRLSTWNAGVEQKGWTIPSKLLETLSKEPKPKRIRLVLATPAIFTQGWLPGWLKRSGEYLEGRPPGAPENLRLRLVSACVDRWRPISGWSLEADSRGRRGPKAIRRLVPAGSVYFFKVEDGDAGKLAEKLWLEPVSDESQDRLDQDRRDGFGLALWGVWNAHDERVQKY